jgi:Transcriptional regulators
MLWPTRHEHAREVALLTELVEATDGAVLVLPEQSSDELLAASSGRYPLVVVDPRVRLDARIPSVAAANASGVEQAMQHLLELGHRRIAAITGPPGWVATEERRQAYRGALAAAGIEFDPALELEADFDFEPGSQAAAALLELEQPPTAIFAFSDMIAIGAMRAARYRGISDPGRAVDRRVRRQRLRHRRPSGADDRASAARRDGRDGGRSPREVHAGGDRRHAAPGAVHTPRRA